MVGRGLVGFNSTLVRLKATKDLTEQELSFCFNSTLVRLKVKYPANFIIDVIGFQFHFGTIKRLFLMISIIMFAMFQFHFGTIKSVAAKKPKFAFMKFQFHFGTIKSIEHMRTARGRMCVSIPLWYD